MVSIYLVTATQGGGQGEGRWVFVHSTKILINSEIPIRSYRKPIYWYTGIGKLLIGVDHSLRIALSKLALHFRSSADKNQSEVEGFSVKSEKGYFCKSEEILRRDTFANLPNVSYGE